MYRAHTQGEGGVYFPPPKYKKCTLTNKNNNIEKKYFKKFVSGIAPSLMALTSEYGYIHRIIRHMDRWLR